MQYYMTSRPPLIKSSRYSKGSSIFKNSTISGFSTLNPEIRCSSHSLSQ